MKVRVYKTPEISEECYHYTSDILKDAFRERTQQGIHFQCGFFAPADVKSYFTKETNGYLFVAWESDLPVGILMTKSRVKGPFKFIRHDYLAIKEEYKGRGIGSFLFKSLLELSQKEKYDFIASVTNPIATSSVKYHLKQGFRIFCKNYNGKDSEYSFIYPLSKFRFLNVFVLQKIIYAVVTSLGYMKNKIKNR